MYHIRAPVEWIYYDHIIRQINCEVRTGAAPMYHLRKPAPSWWSYNVPSGFSYSAAKVVGNRLLGLQDVEYLLE
jgi:hypothetical protein